MRSNKDKDVREPRVWLGKEREEQVEMKQKVGNGGTVREVREGKESRDQHWRA